MKTYFITCKNCGRQNFFHESELPEINHHGNCNCFDSEGRYEFFCCQSCHDQKKPKLSWYKKHKPRIIAVIGLIILCIAVLLWRHEEHAAGWGLMCYIYYQFGKLAGKESQSNNEKK